MEDAKRKLAQAAAQEEQNPPVVFMKQYIAKKYHVVDIHTDDELDAVVTDIVDSYRESLRHIGGSPPPPVLGLDNKRLRPLAEETLFSDAVFRLGIEFPTQSSLGLPGFVDPRLDGWAWGMASLQEEFAHLETLSLHLRVNVTSPTRESANAEEWMKDAKDIVFKPLFRQCVSFGLDEAKDTGPGKKKIFKLSILCRVMIDGNEVLRSGGKRWIRRSQNIEINEIDDGETLHLKAWESCEKAALD